jgi:hypothetical protein
MSIWSSVIDYLASLGLWALFCFKGLGFGAGDLCVALGALNLKGDLWVLFCLKGLRFGVSDLCTTLWTLNL